MSRFAFGWKPGRLPALAIALLLAVGGYGCGTPNTPADLPNYTMVLCDNTDVEYQYTYIVENRQVLLIVGSSPKTRGPRPQARFYAHPSVPLELYETLRLLSGIRGHGEHSAQAETQMPYWRWLYAHEQPGELPVAPQEDYFTDGAFLQPKMLQLKNFMLQQERSVQGPPNWAFRNPVVNQRLQLEGR